MKVIIGLGKTGLSCARFLQRLNVPFAITDSRGNPPNLAEFKRHFSNIKVILGCIDEELLLQADEIIISPGVSTSLPCFTRVKALGIPIISDIELFARYAQGKVIGITGSNGKSTVTSLLAMMVKKAGFSVKAGGNLGIPALDLLINPSEWTILELSSFQLENTYNLSLHAATILNVTPDHMDRYQSFSGYLQAKQRIYRNCRTAIVNYQDKNTQVCDSYQPASICYFGRVPPQKDEFSIIGDEIVMDNKSLAPIKDLIIKGQHNVNNAVAALTLGKVMELPLASMLQALLEFPGLPHRGEVVLTHKGIRWINDSKATNPGAVVAVLEGLGQHMAGRIILIAGGQAKDAEFTDLRDSVKKYTRNVLLFGQDKILLQQALQDVANISIVENLDEAIMRAQQLAKADDTVLLAPACASFDMFRHYMERGDAFKQSVKRLLA